MNYDDALDLAKKLLSTNGRTPEEAAAFAAKAQQIIDKYRLNVSDLNYDAQEAERADEPIQNFGYADPLDDKVKYRDYESHWSIRLASVVAYYNGCRVFHCKNMEERKQDRSVSIRIVGRGSDVEAVRYLYAFFKRQIKDLQSRETRGHSSTYKGEFADGCVDTLDKRFDAQRKETFAEVRAENSGSELALVRVNKAIARMENPTGDVDKWIEDERDRASAIRYGVSLEEYRKDPIAAMAKSAGMSQEEFLKASRNMPRGRGCGPGLGSAGDRVSSGGREHGQRAGESIRMTGAKAGLGSGTKQIN